MNCFYFILVLLVLASSLNCVQAGRVFCNNNSSLPCDFDVIVDASAINLRQQCTCNNDHYYCDIDFSQLVKNSSDANRMQVYIEIINNNCKMKDSRIFLQQVSLNEAKEIMYLNEKKFPMRLDTNVSYENGVQGLQIYFMDTQMNANSFAFYDNLTTLSIHTNVKQEVSVDQFLKLKKLKTLEWYSDVPYVFSSDLLFELNYHLEELLIEFKKEIVDKPSTNEACKKFQFDLRKVFGLRKLHIHRTFYDCIRKDLLRRLYGLHHLTLAFNSQLKKLPMGIFEDLISLKTLHLMYNGLETLEGELFNGLEYLKEMDLSHNNLKELNWQWPLLPKLEYLNVAMNNNLTTINIYLKTGSFQYLMYPGKQASSIKTDAFVCTTREICHLYLDKEGKPCPKNCKCILYKASKDFRVNCTNANWEELPYVPISNVDTITTLDISNNVNMKVLPTRNVYGYDAVVNLLASGNEFQDLTLDQLPLKVGYLDLSNNNYTNMRKEIFDFFYKERYRMSIILLFKLSGNPWTCDCNLCSFARFTRRARQLIVDEQNVTCIEDNSSVRLKTDDELCKVYRISHSSSGSKNDSGTDTDTDTDSGNESINDEYESTDYQYWLD